MQVTIWRCASLLSNMFNVIWISEYNENWNNFQFTFSLKVRPRIEQVGPYIQNTQHRKKIGKGAKVCGVNAIVKAITDLFWPLVWCNIMLNEMCTKLIQNICEIFLLKNVYKCKSWRKMETWRPNCKNWTKFASFLGLLWAKLCQENWCLEVRMPYIKTRLEPWW